LKLLFDSTGSVQGKPCYETATTAPSHLQTTNFHDKARWETEQPNVKDANCEDGKLDIAPGMLQKLYQYGTELFSHS